MGFSCSYEDIFGITRTLRCPEPGQPEDWRFCCGSKDSRHCCESFIDTVHAKGAIEVIASIVTGFIILCVVVCCICCFCCPFCIMYKRRQRGNVYNRNNRQQAGAVTTQVVTQHAPHNQAHPQQAVPPPYPQQQPGIPAQGYPQHAYGPVAQGYPPGGPTPQGYPPTGPLPQGYPPTGPAPQGYPHPQPYPPYPGANDQPPPYPGGPPGPPVESGEVQKQLPYNPNF